MINMKLVTMTASELDDTRVAWFAAGLFAATLFLTGCGDVTFLEVPDEVDVTTDVDEAVTEAAEELTEEAIQVAIDQALEDAAPVMKVIDGQVFVKYGDWCVAIDARTDYPDTFTPMDEFDGYRGRYSSGEKFYCKEES